MHTVGGVEIFKDSDFTAIERPGVVSLQLLWPHNSKDAAITITRVTVAPGISQARHSHAGAEQVWYVEKGTAELLLDGGAKEIIFAPCIVRTPPGKVHGINNIGTEDFVYLSSTTPPPDFSRVYPQGGKT